MSRQLLAADNIDSGITEKIGGEFNDTVNEVVAAIDDNRVVVIGMDQNPYCKKARKNLDQAGISFLYLAYGSYIKEWKRRLAIKMWCGWSTFPIVFVDGKLVGGNEEVEILIASGGLK